MKLHEFQSKDLLARFGVAVPRGRVAVTPEQAHDIAASLDAQTYAVKAQIHAGGRGRAGGVRIVRTPALAETAAQALLGQRLVTTQTGPAGQLIKRVLVETAVPVARTLHLSLLVDRTIGEVVLLASRAGGEDIEDRVLSGDLRLERLPLGSGRMMRQEEAAGLAGRLGLEGAEVSAFLGLIDGLRQAFIELDASLIEINPVVVTPDGAFIAADAKIDIDDNALFRQSDLAALQEDDDTDPIEVGAQRRQLNYVRMDGNIGLVVNGAGLGLATLDMVRAARGRPANFMDIRTTAKSLDVAYGFGLLLDNPAVRAILINVHGGGMQPCDTIAEGLGIAMRRTGRSCPTVVRFAGNNAEFARSRLVNFGVKFVDCPDMWTAATKAVAAAQ